MVGGLLCDEPRVAMSSGGQASDLTADPWPVVSAQGGDTQCVRRLGGGDRAPLRLLSPTLRLHLSTCPLAYHSPEELVQFPDPTPSPRTSPHHPEPSLSSG